MFLDLSRRHSIEDLLPFEDHADPELLLEVLNTHESGLQVLSAPHSIEEAASVTPTDVRSILQDLRSRFGWVVVDTLTAVDDLTLAIFEEADFVVNVLTPDIPAIKSSRAFLELLDTIGVSADKVIHVLNMVENRKGISSKSIEENLQSEILAEIPYDRSAILEAVNKGEPTVLSGKTKPFSRGIYNLLAKIRENDQKVAEAEPVLDA